MTEPRTAGRPNILWVSVEDINPLLGCYGDRYARTPNVDALAAEGIRYTNARTPWRRCAPCPAPPSSPGWRRSRSAPTTTAPG